MTTPWILLGGAVFWALSMYAAFDVGRRAELGAQYREEEAARKAGKVATQAAALAISRIEVQRVEITQPVIREISREVRYAECKHTPDVLRNINSAITGQRAGDGKLPGTSGAQ